MNFFPSGPAMRLGFSVLLLLFVMLKGEGERSFFEFGLPFFPVVCLNLLFGVSVFFSLLNRPPGVCVILSRSRSDVVVDSFFSDLSLYFFLRGGGGDTSEVSLPGFWLPRVSWEAGPMNSVVMLLKEVRPVSYIFEIVLSIPKNSYVSAQG